MKWGGLLRKWLIAFTIELFGCDEGEGLITLRVQLPLQYSWAMEEEEGRVIVLKF